MPIKSMKRYTDLVFFFSSRRRHTRYWRDWSSDVCSSDLGAALAQQRADRRYAGPLHRGAVAREADERPEVRAVQGAVRGGPGGAGLPLPRQDRKSVV